MAITKLMHMKECHSGGKISAHLSNSINYILNPDKYMDSRWIGGMNLSVADMTDAHAIYEQFMSTKKLLGKEEGRQGYHFVLAFPPEEAVDNETAYKITQEFVEKYIGDKYETVFALHQDKEHLHSHIIFNSVDLIEGKKYHYKDGDWKRDIQPITNELCEKYGLSTIDFIGESDRVNMKYDEWQRKKKGEYAWPDVIRSDIDEAINAVSSFDNFIEYLKNIGYHVRTGQSQKYGEYMSLKPDGKPRAVRNYHLGQLYSVSEIRRRIEGIKKELPPIVLENNSPKVKKAAYVPKAKNTYRYSIWQKRHFAFCYRLGLIKKGKKNYNNYYKYRKDILKLQEYNKRTSLIIRYNIQNADDCLLFLVRSNEQIHQIDNELKRVYQERYAYKELFQMYDDFDSLSPEEKVAFFDLLENYRIPFPEFEAYYADCNQRLSQLKKEKAEIRKKQKTIKEMIDVPVGDIPQRQKQEEKEVSKNKNQVL